MRVAESSPDFLRVGFPHVRSATYSPDGRHIVAASQDRTARVWEADSGRLVAELKGHGASVRSANSSPDGRRIVTASADKTARVWEADSGRLVADANGNYDCLRYGRCGVLGRQRVEWPPGCGQQGSALLGLQVIEAPGTRACGEPAARRHRHGGAQLTKSDGTGKPALSAECSFHPTETMLPR